MLRDLSVFLPEMSKARKFIRESGGVTVWEVRWLAEGGQSRLSDVLYPVWTWRWNISAASSKICFWSCSLKYNFYSASSAIGWWIDKFSREIWPPNCSESPKSDCNLPLAFQFVCLVVSIVIFRAVSVHVPQITLTKHWYALDMGTIYYAVFYMLSVLHHVHFFDAYTSCDPPEASSLSTDCDSCSLQGVLMCSWQQDSW